MIQYSMFCDICGKPINTSVGGGRFDMNYWDAIKTTNTSFPTQSCSKVYDLCPDCCKIIAKEIRRHKNTIALHNNSNR